MRDPHPQVDGEGIRILQAAGVEVIEGVCEDQVRRQLGAWVVEHHPQDVLNRAANQASGNRVAQLADMYQVDPLRIETLLQNVSTR